MSCETETEISDEQFSALVKFADAPLPAPVKATIDDLRENLAFLASTLRANPTSDVVQGKLKLGAYKLALRGVSKAALEFASTTAIKEGVWMPLPSELKKLCDRYLAPSKGAHAKAQRLVRDRRQREFEETLTNLDLRKMPESELANLSENTAKVALTRGSILIRLDGSRCYRTADAINSDREERRAAMHGSLPTVSGSSRAQDNAG